MTTSILTETDFGTQEEDMGAINQYMRTKPIVNNAAFPIKDDFVRWWDNLSWYDKSMSGDAYDEARTRRNKFNLANVKNEQERADVVKVITTGVTTEEMQGKSRPTTLSTGEVGAQVKKSSKTGTMAGNTRPTIRKGSSGAAVSEWQRIIGVDPDGNFGSGTETATKKWQRDHGLDPDGVVGSNTWNVALGSKPSDSGFRSPDQPATPSRPTLRKGSTGAAVTEWQSILGISPTTGFFGDVTVRLTTQYQQAHGLPATGVVDAKTWETALSGRGAFAPPSPSPQPFAPSPGPSPKPLPSPTPKPEEKKKPGKRKVTQIVQASMFDFTKWPTPVKIFAGLTGLGGLALAFVSGKKH